MSEEINKSGDEEVIANNEYVQFSVLYHIMTLMIFTSYDTN